MQLEHKCSSEKANRRPRPRRNFCDFRGRELRALWAKLFANVEVSTRRRCLSTLNLAPWLKRRKNEE